MSITYQRVWERAAYYWMDACEDEIKGWPGFSDFKLGLFKLDWSKRRRSSRGGLYGNAPGISIAMHLATRDPQGVAKCYEYKSFDDDPVIGGFYYKDTSYKLAMHICHEMAHAAQFYAAYITRTQDIDRPHGDSFKNPYRKLRISILNPRLEPQEPLKQEYEDFIKKNFK